MRVLSKTPTFNFQRPQNSLQPPQIIIIIIIHFQTAPDHVLFATPFQARRHSKSLQQHADLMVNFSRLSVTIVPAVENPWKEAILYNSNPDRIQTVLPTCTGSIEYFQPDLENRFNWRMASRCHLSRLTRIRHWKSFSHLRPIISLFIRVISAITPWYLGILCTSKLQCFSLHQFCPFSPSQPATLHIFHPAPFLQET